MSSTADHSDPQHTTKQMKKDLESSNITVENSLQLANDKLNIMRILVADLELAKMSISAALSSLEQNSSKVAE